MSTNPPTFNKPKKPNYLSTTNACKLCKPLGACLAFKGIEGAVPYLHGSQGCATYMRRYIISHYNEPIDIASSSLSEKHAVYGGGPNLKLGLTNVAAKYRPELIGIATTCLTETIGDDVAMYLRQYAEDTKGSVGLPTFVNVSTPSYSGTHMEGFQTAVREVVAQLSEGGPRSETVNLLPGFVSSADYRLLHEILADFGLNATVLPDLSETMDGPALLEYEKIQGGGTPIAAIKAMGRAKATIEFGTTLGAMTTAGDVLREKFSVMHHRIGMPIGIRETDVFFNLLEELSGQPTPEKYVKQRGRLVDAYVDGHKYVFGKRAVVYGEEDLVVGLCAFLAEIGIQPVLCATGGTSGKLKEAIAAVTGDTLLEQPQVFEDVDFYEINEMAGQMNIDLVVGHSKGYPLAKKLDIPLIRVGFPIHDRIGGQRILHLGYSGAQQLFDTVTNALIEKKQDDSPVGYFYM
ncbi:Nitrogenase [Desulfobulbus propionicus DSM 2032]|jgi:nitrogenase molybdenum-iron protein NifN|uniref:Nitrogenase n=1 Tax=Desulfobulbus propionicus (strain ATCC 33891 / DSM 2032 / VKM B-1956 / 1pr3) TaxID=577650 RepID=A0A7U3YNW7_DESPD|nr:nitrogenase component 1 [Desulfobulbus propionicus]ADW18840.1 Nitrogenase [Desulfobulbus propionicus DSM 2032]